MRFFLVISAVLILLESTPIITEDDTPFSRLLSPIVDSSVEGTPHSTQWPIYEEFASPSFNQSIQSSDPSIKVRVKRVVGGFDAPQGVFKYAAAIRHKKTKDHHCGATLIHTKFLITAAHCFDDTTDPRKFDIVMGDWDNKRKEGTEQWKIIKRIHKHPCYKGGNKMENDIAIIELKYPVVLNKHVSVARLPTSKFNYFDGRLCVVKGWGTTLPEKERNPNRLQVALVPLIDRNKCMDSSHMNEYIHSSFLCAGYVNGGIDACAGDSGGPLVCQENDGAFYVIGVTSWGYGCAEKKHPGLYTKVASYLQWIKDHIKGKRSTRICKNRQRRL